QARAFQRSMQKAKRKSCQIKTALPKKSGSTALFHLIAAENNALGHPISWLALLAQDKVRSRKLPPAREWRLSEVLFYKE
ncbi:MAG: hypothetical protein KA994_07195, partial [Brachymonas sp.]|nr:hypothetical protein [Brachymonas sp.]